MSDAQTYISDDEITALLADRIDRAKQSVGIVVGLIDSEGTRTIGYGKPSESSNQTVNSETVFEIGSVTKVFTATLLADMAERGEVSLDDPISRYLPKSVKSPTFSGKEITLLHLSNHSSGLPRMPSNFAPKDNENPYADYSIEQMYAFLSAYTLGCDIGAKYEYSNYGAGLLGHILALRAGTDYETMIQTRICQPLKMLNTHVLLTDSMRLRLAAGHSQMLKPVASWDIPTLAGAGALRSTTEDLLKFVAANLGIATSPLLVAMQKTFRSRYDTGTPDTDVGLGWHILNRHNTRIVWHNGGTAGYHSFIGFDEKRLKGVVVLSNCYNFIDDIGYHLIESQCPLAKIEPPRERRAIELHLGLLDQYVGDYKFASAEILTFSREGNRFYAQLTGQGKYEVFAETDNDFFWGVVDAQVTFIKDEKGHLTHVVLHQNGRDQDAQRIR